MVSLSRYLPSAQFAVMALSIGLSGGLVFFAQHYVEKQNNPATLSTTEDQAAQDEANWQQQLQQIQAQSGITLPPAPDASAVNTLLGAAKSPNITDTISRTLYINLSSAAAQGLGSDLPTQNQIIASAFAQLPQTADRSYTQGDLTTVPDNPGSLRAYGNGVVMVLQHHPEADASKVLQLVGSAVDNDDKTYFQKVGPVKDAYLGIAQELLQTPVPQTLSPLHLSLIANFQAIATALADIEATPQDPLRGLVGLQHFQLAAQETQRVLTTIAQGINKRDILFTKDEPGSALSALLGASS